MYGSRASRSVDESPIAMATTPPATNTIARPMTSVRAVDARSASCPPETSRANAPATASAGGSQDGRSVRATSSHSTIAAASVNACGTRTNAPTYAPASRRCTRRSTSCARLMSRIASRRMTSVAAYRSAAANRERYVTMRPPMPAGTSVSSTTIIPEIARPRPCRRPTNSVGRAAGMITAVHTRACGAPNERAISARRWSITRTAARAFRPSSGSANSTTTATRALRPRPRATMIAGMTAIIGMTSRRSSQYENERSSSRLRPSAKPIGIASAAAMGKPMTSARLLARSAAPSVPSAESARRCDTVTVNGGRKNPPLARPSASQPPRSTARSATRIAAIATMRRGPATRSVPDRLQCGVERRTVAALRGRGRLGDELARRQRRQGRADVRAVHAAILRPDARVGVELRELRPEVRGRVRNVLRDRLGEALLIGVRVPVRLELRDDVLLHEIRIGPQQLRPREDDRIHEVGALLRDVEDRVELPGCELFERRQVGELDHRPVELSGGERLHAVRRSRDDEDIRLHARELLEHDVRVERRGRHGGVDAHLETAEL